MKKHLIPVLMLLAVTAAAAEFDPLRREFGITVGPLGRFDGNGAGISNVLSAADLVGLGSAPAADRILFYDFSAGGFRYLTAGSGLSISDTTLTSSGGSFNGDGLTLTNTAWKTDKGIQVASLNENGTFTLVDTNGNTRLIIDPIGDTIGLYDSNLNLKILIRNEKLRLHDPIIENGTTITGSGAGLTNVNAATATVVDSTDATSYPLLADSATGNLAVKTDAGLTYDASTGTLGVNGINVTNGATVGTISTPLVLNTGTGNTNTFAQFGPNGNNTNGIPGLTLPPFNAVNGTNLFGLAATNSPISNTVLRATSTSTAEWATPSAAGGGGGPSIEGFLKNVFLWEECIGNVNTTPSGVFMFVRSISGAGAAFQTGTATTTSPGIWTGSTGTTTTGYGAVHTANFYYSMQFGAGTYTNEWRVRVPTLPSAAEPFNVRIGFDSTTTATPGADAAYFRCTTNSANWIAVTRRNNSESLWDTGVAAAANTWTRLRIVVNSDATSISFTVDGVGTNATSNLPISGDDVALHCSVLKDGAGTTARTADVDFCGLAFGLNTSR